MVINTFMHVLWSGGGRLFDSGCSGGIDFELMKKIIQPIDCFRVSKKSGEIFNAPKDGRTIRFSVIRLRLFCPVFLSDGFVDLLKSWAADFKPHLLSTYGSSFSSLKISF